MRIDVFKLPKIKPQKHVTYPVPNSVLKCDLLKKTGYDAQQTTLRFATVKRRVKRIKVFAVQMILRNTQRVTETLIVYDLAFPQISDRIAYVRVICHTQNIIIGHTCLLFCYYHVFATKLSFAKARKILIFQDVLQFIPRKNFG